MEQLSQSSCLQQDEKIRLLAKELTFLDKGPFSFAVMRGECVGLSGQSGIGKTLLLKALTDLISFHGEVLFDGNKSCDLPAPEWRSKVTMVPAESFWWYDNVGEHFPDRGLSVSLGDLLAKLGFEADVLDWQISRMSTGERQRLALLRSLQNKPAVVLLDEPTSNLDSYHAGLVETLVEEYRISNEAAMVWVSHDLGQLQRVAGRHLKMTAEGVFEIALNPITSSG